MLPGAAFLNYTGISNGGAGPNSVPPRATPKWKALTTFGYKSDTLGLGLRWRYQGALADVSSVLTPNNVQLPVAAYNLWDMFASMKVQKNIEFRFGVNNLFDKGLPFVASSQISTDPALYDLIGRSFYVGARISF